VSARALLLDLTRQGVVLEVRGGRLVVEGPSQTLTDTCVERLRAVKGELIRILDISGTTQWDVGDYQAFFDERAAILEFEAGLAHVEAERRAFSGTAQQWLSQNPAPATHPRGGCVHCLDDDQRGNPLIPVLTAGGHTFLHDRGWDAWRTFRREQAETALRQMGVGQFTTLPDQPEDAEARYDNNDDEEIKS
jgi:hypothetical protein